MPEITVWTKQNAAVLDQLKEKGRFTADEGYIRRELESTTDIMLNIYRWLADHVTIAVDKPADVIYPVWVSFDREATMMPEPGYVVLELRLDTSQIAAIDVIKWTKITNYSYIPADKEDEQAHNRLLEDAGTDNARAVMTQFYPEIRRKVINSWDRLFEPSSRPGDPGTYGLIWEVKSEWVQRIIT